MRGWVFVALSLLAPAPARADCDGFKWSLAREKAWFAGAPEPVDSGGEIAAGRAYEVALKPEEAVSYPEPPKKKTPGASGAVLRTAPLAKAGLYQITLSREAWVDAVQNGARARTRNVSRQRDCAAFVKSVRFQLEAGPAVLEISGVAASSLGVALGSAE